ncbi:MAG: phenylalanine--tRNA ligase subunit beta [Chloroflexi bacterium]|nr:phenylalanine--tRNA ligase subunit beta [Chloroflexota bacterium]
MKVPLSWLKSYVDVPLPPEGLAHRLTMAGLEVSGITTVGGSWDNVFVGQVVALEPHPNADRLKLATVDLGGERCSAVCGAPNVAPGQKIAFAKPGARLFDPQSGRLETLKAARIRGVLSGGMVCSERELGLGEDHTGILVLDSPAPVGAPLSEYLGDAVLDLEATSNRPDWLSLLGVAHEVAALTNEAVREPEARYPEEDVPIERQVTIRVEAPDLAPRYTASLISGVRVGPSPRWLQDRLVRAGQRPIVNIVDITNYVMLEYGQPLHAFDVAALEGRTVLVRRARPEEALVTLDGETRQLGPEMLVIADARRPVGLAGVIGGRNSEIGETTNAVLLESANFNAVSIRRTAQALKLRTEASLRFERHLNPDLAPLALRRATQLIRELAGGTVARGIVDLYPGYQPRPPVRLPLRRVEQVLGMRTSIDVAERVLTSLGFPCQRDDGEALQVEVPYWRSDIEMADDLVEELARTIGYDAVPTTFLSRSIPPHQPQPLRELRERVRDLLVAAGMQEVISYSLTSRQALDRSGALPQGPEPLRVANPMSPDQEYLRTSLRGSLLSTLAANQRSGEAGLKLFEVGRVYLPLAGDLPEERETAAGVLWGERAPLSWSGDRGKMDFFDAKGMVEALLSGLGVGGEFSAAQDPLLHPGRTAALLVQGQQVGVVGEVRPDALEGFGIGGGVVALFELDLGRLLALVPRRARGFVALPRFPGSQRDVALVVDAETPAARLEVIIRRQPLVQEVVLFDVYAGTGVPQDMRSLAFRITFRSSAHTLTAEEVNAALEAVLRDLEREAGARLRG